jgi:hypothetical protein
MHFYLLHNFTHFIFPSKHEDELEKTLGMVGNVKSVFGCFWRVFGFLKISNKFFAILRGHLPPQIQKFDF